MSMMDLRRVPARIVSGCVLVMLSTMAVRAQSPETAGKAAHPPAHAKPTPTPTPRNLKVLPPDTTDDEIEQLMVSYRQELGVKCSYCHVADAQTQRLDYASDDNPRNRPRAS